jgi:hypothetical protein
MSVRFLEGICVTTGIVAVREGDGERTAACAGEAEVGPNAGSSLASGDFDAAGHVPLGEGRKGPRVRARALSWTVF